MALFRQGRLMHGSGPSASRWLDYSPWQSSTPLAYWVGHTRELALLIKGKLQLLNQPLAIFDEIAHALSGISGGPESASTVRYDTSTIISGILSTLTPVITQFVLFFFAMIFWMLYANEIKGGIAHLF